MKILNKVNDKINAHNADLSTLFLHDDKIFSGAEDGKIKIWKESDLKFLGEINAHPNSGVHNMAISGNKLYSCSNDCTIKLWDLNKLEPIATIFKSDRDAVQKLILSRDGTTLYSGDDKGIVNVWKDDKIVASTDTMEEVRDMMVLDNYLFTVRDTDLIVTEMYPGDEYRFLIKAVLEGASAPMCVASNKLLFVGRNGKDVCVHDNKPELSYPEVGHIADAHKMIINCVCGYEKDSAAVLFTGGWDHFVTKWKLSGHAIPEKLVCNLDTGVNAMIFNETKEILYVGGSEGKLIAIQC